MIAYTSVNHMGYILLAVGAAGIVAGTAAQARELAVTGAVTQMVSHGLLTGALFLLSGVLYERGHTYDMAPTPAWPRGLRCSPGSPWSPRSGRSASRACPGSSPSSRSSPAASPRPPWQR